MSDLFSAGVDEHELDAGPIGPVVAAVSRDAALFVNDGVSSFRYAIDESRLAHVRATDDGYEWESHDPSEVRSRQTNQSGRQAGLRGHRIPE